MFKNIDISEINKRRVLRSISVLVLSFLIISYVVTVSFIYWDTGVVQLLFPLLIVLGYVVVAAGFLTLFLLVCLAAESLFIRQSTSEKGVIIILITEVLTITGFSLLIFTEFQYEFTCYLLLILAVSQFLRFLYLRRKDRMFNTANN